MINKINFYSLEQFILADAQALQETPCLRRQCDIQRRRHNLQQIQCFAKWYGETTKAKDSCHRVISQCHQTRLFAGWKGISRAPGQRIRR